jgi:hypothetical protein
MELSFRRRCTSGRLAYRKLFKCDANAASRSFAGLRRVDGIFSKVRNFPASVQIDGFSLKEGDVPLINTTHDDDSTIPSSRKRRQTLAPSGGAGGESMGCQRGTQPSEPAMMQTTNRNKGDVI